MTTSTKTYIGYVITKDGYILAQVPSDDPRGKGGFMLCDDDQTFEVGVTSFPFGEWVAIADDDSRITCERREGLQWVIDDARAARDD